MNSKAEFLFCHEWTFLYEINKSSYIYIYVLFNHCTMTIFSKVFHTLPLLIILKTFTPPISRGGLNDILLGGKSSGLSQVSD